MRKTLLFMLALGTGGAVFAQAVQPMPLQRDSIAQKTSAQRRSELRDMLSAGRRAEPTDQADPAVPAGRQLSQQERAEMREQLRRYKPAGASRSRKP